MPTATNHQLFPPLDEATEAALRASIERFGVLVPVVVDQDGQILDGHHRSRIAGDLGVKYEARVVTVKDEDEAREIARTLNEDRRMLTREQRLPVVVALREEGHSYRAIGGALKVSDWTAREDVRQAQVRGTLHLPERVAGQDGKSYPASRAKTDRQKQRENAHLGRIKTGIASILGSCKGVEEINLKLAAEAASPGELKKLAKRAEECATRLNKFAKRLQEEA